MERALAVLLWSSSAALSRAIVITAEAEPGGVDLEHAGPGCYARILEKSMCANSELAEKYKDWVLEKDPKSRTPHGCRAVGSRLDLKCNLGFGSVQTTFKKGPRDAKVTVATERARGKKVAEEERAELEREAAENAEKEARWQAEGEAQVQRQIEDRELDLKRREEELAQFRKEERVNAESRKRREAKRQAEEAARAQAELHRGFDLELSEQHRREQQAIAELEKAKAAAEAVHAKFARKREDWAKEEVAQEAAWAKEEAKAREEAKAKEEAWAKEEVRMAEARLTEEAWEREAAVKR